MEVAMNPAGPCCASLWPGAAWLVLCTSTLAAQAQPSLADLEKRVGELEARLLKGPGTSTRIRAPFEVVDAAGNVILQVTQGAPGGASVAIWQIGKGQGVLTFQRNGHEIAGIGVGDKGDGELYISDAGGTERAEILGSGLLSIRDKEGSPVAGIVARENGYGRFVLSHGETIAATLEEDENGGLLQINNKSGETVAEAGADDEGAGGVSILDGDYELVALRPADIGDGGEVVISNGEGKHLATLGASSTKDDGGELVISTGTGKQLVSIGPSKSNGGAGAVSVHSADGKPMANLTGTGALLIGNYKGQVVAQMKAGADGVGLVQINRPGGGPQAVLGADASGGLLQVENAAGTPVASFKAGETGGGYFQLTNSGGQPTVEGGTLGNGRGFVHAGPIYRCNSNLGMGMVPTAAGLSPDCLIGLLK
jgi:hypothetical protein